MIIVSQDKDRIFNFDNLTNILATSAGEDNEWCIKVIFLNLDFEVIGYYRTEERAKEVLEEIKYWQFQFELFKVVSAEKQEEMQDFFERYNREFNIYEMPAD